MRKCFVTVGIAVALGAVRFASAAPVEFTASGSQPSEIQSAVDAFRNTLGTNHGVLHGTGNVFDSGRREINWDGVPDAVAAPNLMPPNFFNANSAARHVVVLDAELGFRDQRQGRQSDRNAGRIRRHRWGPAEPVPDIQPATLCSRRSTVRVTESLFFVPGTNTTATVTGFGSIPSRTSRRKA